MYELPHKLSNDLRLRILRNKEISRKSQNFIELKSSAQPSSQNENFFNTVLIKNSWKKKLNFSRNILFYMKNWVCLKYFVHDCIWKRFFASNSPQTPLNLICSTIFGTLGPLTQFWPAIREINLQKSAKICLSW